MMFAYTIISSLPLVSHSKRFNIPEDGYELMVKYWANAFVHLL
jgi:hypothetical protein